MTEKFTPIKLEEFCSTIDSGFAFKSENFSESPDDVFLIKGSNLGCRVIEWNAGPWWNASEYEKYQRYQLHADDIVLAMDRPIVGGKLKFFWLNEGDPKSLLVQRVVRLKANDPKDQKFLRYIIASPTFLRYVDTITTGVNVPHISGPDIRKFQFLLPLPKTRRKIGEFVGVYDDLIEKNLKRIKLLEESARLTFEEWFLRFRIDGKKLDIDPDTGLPFGWNRVSLSSTGDFLNGYAFKPRELLEDGIPIIKIKEMKSGVVDDTPRNPGDEIDNKYLVSRGDILFSWSATLEVIQWEHENGWLNQHLFKVTPKTKISKSFLYLSLKNSLQIFEYLTTGATMKHIKRKELDFVEIPLPPFDDLLKFENLVEPMISEILNFSHQNQLLKEARDILLPRLMAGMIDTDDMDIDV